MFFYFLADLLHNLAILSKVFLYKYVDVTIIGSQIRTQIESICMLYVVDNTDLTKMPLMKMLVIISFHNMVLLVDIFKDY